MKRFITLLAVAAFVVAIPASHLLRGGGGQVGALEPGEHGSATVASGFLCGVYYTLTTDSHATLSNSGNETLTCRGDLPGHITPPLKAVIWNGIPCNLRFSGVATGSKLVTTPAGELILKCSGKK